MQSSASGASGSSPAVAQGAGVEAAALIRQAIFDGRLPPGERLKEEWLAAEFGFSRTPVREALQTLGTEGLLVMQHHRGATVRLYSPEEIQEIYGLRAVLEGYAARLAAQDIAPDRLDELAQSCERFEALRDDEDVGAYIEENNGFHGVILEAAGLDRLTTMVRSVVELPLVYRSFLWYSDEDRQASARCHRQIVRALRTRDTERAEITMKEHVFEARDLLVGHLRASEGDGQGPTRRTKTGVMTAYGRKP